MLRRLVLALGLAASLSAAAGEEALPAVEIYMPSPCLACIEWGVHLMDNGFKVTYRETADMAAVKRRLKVPKDLESVHTARVAGYFVEGHVPAEDIKMLLQEKPKARGIAVPGLPKGAPGREMSNPTCETACTMLDNTSGEREVRHELYETFLVDLKGKVSRWARH
jgi:hypothetical protein